MNDHNAEGCGMAHRPTLGQRAARALGFRHHLGAEPAEAEQLTQGWARTTTRLRFSFLDRLRLLVSGRLTIEHTHYADTPIVTMRNRVDFTLFAPWEKDHD